MDCEWHLYAQVGSETTKLSFPSWQMVIDRVPSLASEHPLLNTIRYEVNHATPGQSWTLAGADCLFKLRPLRSHKPMDLTPFIEIHETEGEHAEHGASSAYRWLACPGSISLVRHVTETQPEALPPSSLYAKEGTAAHQLAQMALTDGQDAIAYIDRPVYLYNHETGEISDTIYVGEEMATAVQVWLDECRKHELCDVCQVETRLSLRKLNPPVPMYGTCDFYAIDFVNRILYVKDYKHGAGVPVEAIGNPQPMYYALLVLVNLPPTVPQIERIKTMIVQPRAPGNPIKTAEYTRQELLDWAENTLFPGVLETLKPNAPLAAGKHCQFCPAFGACEEAARVATETAMLNFEADAETVQQQLPDPHLLSQHELSQRRLAFQFVRQWMDAVDDTLLSLIQAGREDDNWIVVKGEGKRKWIDDEKTIETLRKLGIDADKLYSKKLVSPKQAEDLAVRDLRAMKLPLNTVKTMVKNTIGKLTVRPETSPALVAKGSARQQLPGVAAEFEADVLETP